MASIMIVDDDSVYSCELARTLQRRYKSRYYIERRENPQEAIDSFQKAPFEYCLIIVDLQFRNSIEQGPFLLEHLKAMRHARGYDPGPRLIALTGQDEQKTKENLVSFESSGYPFVPKTDYHMLQAHIDKELDQLHLHNLGPTIEIEHTIESCLAIPAHFRCVPGERIAAAAVLDEHSPRKFPIDTNVRALVYLDLLARERLDQSSRFLGVQEIIARLAEHNFYRDVVGNDYRSLKSPDKTVLMNIGRLRLGIAGALDRSGLNYRSYDVLQEQYFYRDGYDQVLDSGLIDRIRRSNRGERQEGKGKLPGVHVRYRLQARVRPYRTPT